MGMDRRDFLKWGATAGTIGILGGAAAKHKWETRDDHIDTDKLEKKIPRKLADTIKGPSQIDRYDLEATFDEVNSYEDGGTVYTVTVDLPLRDGADTAICPDDETQETAAYKLEPDALRAFNVLYDMTGSYNAEIQDSHEDQIEEYALHFLDDTGETTISLDAEEARSVTQDSKEFKEDKQGHVNAFQEQYRAQFAPDCYEQ